VVVYAQGPDGTSISADTDSVIVAQMPSGFPGTPPSQTASSLPPSNVQLYLSGLSTLYATAGLNTAAQRIARLSGSLNNQPDQTAGHYHAQINWGDSSEWTAGLIVPDPRDPSNFVVEGDHTYYEQGTYPIVVYAQGPDGTSISREINSAIVGPNANPPVPRLTGKANTTVLQGQVIDDVPLATFNDPTPPTNLSAEIDYGDSKSGTADTGPGTIKLVS